MIELRGLSVDYGEGPALHDVSLSVPSGQFLLLTGPSGCGKSTLARAITGLIPHAIAAQITGAVAVAGHHTQATPLPTLARHVGIVLQNPSSQLFHITVAEEVAFGPRNLGLTPEQVQGRVDWALASTGLQDFAARRPMDLSGGEQQRVAIAAVLAMHPRVLVLDEPTASLDAGGTQMVLSTLRRLNRQLQMTIILVEHRLAAALPYAQRLLIMDQGRVVADGAPHELLRDAALRERFGLRRTGAASAPRTWRRLAQERGDQAAGAAPVGDVQPGAQPPLLRLCDVTAGYRGRAVLHNTNLAIYPGDFVAIVGQNGSGKSTLARVIAGLLKPSAGSVHFTRPGRRAPSPPRPGRDVALLFQNPVDQLFTDTVQDELSFGPLNFGAFDGDFHETLLVQAGLHHLRRRCPTRLSVGQQQRCVLAACLALQPHLLILDEPTLGQDWAHLQQLMDFVRQMNQRGTAILLISHDYKLVYRYARRVLLLENGRICLDGQPHPQHTAVQEQGVS